MHPPEMLASYVPHTAQRVLDCSADPVRAAAIKERGGATVVAVAPSAPGAGEELDGYDEIVYGNVADMPLPFEDAYFDCILCDYVLPKHRDVEPLMRELARVLAPGGLALFTAPNVQYFEHMLMLAEGRWDLDDSGTLARDHLRFFTAIELVALARRASLTAQRCGALVTDAPEMWPLDEAQCYRRGNVVIGPLTPDQYKRFLAREYLLVATKP